MPSFIDEIFERLPAVQYSIHIDPEAAVVPLRDALDRIFEEQPVSVTNALPDQTSDIVVVRNGEVVANSSAEELLRAVLLINSDVYISGSRSLTETEFPDVLRALEETRFRLRGYPESDSQKLLFITVSRAIEQLAYERGAGTLRVGFQSFSRLADEPGTYRVYERLSNAELDVHAYGAESEPPPSEFDFTFHTGTSRLYRRCWFVVFRPLSPGSRSSGLFAIERGPNEWEGFWTFRRRRVEKIDRGIEEATAKRTR